MMARRSFVTSPLVGLAEEGRMLVLVFLLVLLWLLGFMTKYTLGGFLHILLVIAIVLGLMNFIRSRV